MDGGSAKRLPHRSHLGRPAHHGCAGRLTRGFRGYQRIRMPRRAVAGARMFTGRR